MNVVPTLGNVGLTPLLPLTLRKNGVEVGDLALVDSGATINVLPYDLGLRLGLDWAQIGGSLPLGGMLANHPAKPVLLEAVIGSFPPVILAFGWTRGPVTHTLLGQINFFLNFDVFFYRAQSYFEIQPATVATP